MSVAAALLLTLGSAQAVPNLAAAVPDGKARVVFFRTGAFYFGGRGCSAYVAETSGVRRVAELGRSEYTVLDTAPGVLRLSGGRNMKKPIVLELAAGETGYVRCEVAGMMGSSRLVHADAPEFGRSRDRLTPAD